MLTVFGVLDDEAFIFPNDGGRRRTDDVTDDVRFFAFVELLRAGGVLEGDLLCRRQNRDVSSLLTFPRLSAEDTYGRW